MTGLAGGVFRGVFPVDGAVCSNSRNGVVLMSNFLRSFRKWDLSTAQFCGQYVGFDDEEGPCSGSTEVLRALDEVAVVLDEKPPGCRAGRSWLLVIARMTVRVCWLMDCVYWWPVSRNSFNENARINVSRSTDEARMTR